MLMKDSESRFVLFPNDPEFLTAVGYFVPAPVSVGLLSGSFDYLAELREVTTMFMSWDSYDEVEHVNLLSLQKCFYAAQKVLAESNGFVRQFLVDDKGCVLIACWGVPTASHPDNARRAVCAGAMISRELMRLGMKTSVGITTGNVFCGSVGSYVRREYAVIGDVVNLAARLMGKSEGRIFIDEATYSRIPPFLKENLVEMEPYKLKGKDKPITPYALKPDKRITLDDRGEGETTIDEMTIRNVCKEPLMQGLERIAKSKAPVSLKFVLIEGQPGTGKIEVVDWLKAHGPPMDVRVISIRMTSKDLSKDYSMVSQLFRLLVRKDTFDHIDRQKMVVRHILRGVYKNDWGTAELVAYPAMQIALGITAQLTDHDVPTKPRKLPSKIIVQCLKDILAYLLLEAPVAFVVEHAHYADQMSWQVLYCLSGLPSLALGVITMDTIEHLELLEYSSASNVRGEIFSSTEASIPLGRLKMVHRRIVKAPHTVIVQMSDCSVDEVEQMIGSLLDGATFSVDLATMVHQLSGGNPYWCREMALFIQSVGPDEFMRAMNPPELQDFAYMTSSNNLTDNDASPVELGRKSLARKGSVKTQPLTQSLKIMSRKNSAQYTKTPTPFAVPRSPWCVSVAVAANNAAINAAATSGSNSGSAAHLPRHKSTSSFNMKASFNVKSSFAVKGRQESGSKTREGDASTATTSKLSVFIVCRFEKLISEDQNILRTASTIGHEFSRDILYGILSPKMRMVMFNSIHSLMKNQWIVETKSQTRRCTEYRFSHPLLYQTLYDLTPASDKARLHYAIASYIEDAYEGDATHFAKLGYHYGKSNDFRPKALEYYVRAAMQYRTHSIDFYDEMLDLVAQAGLYADSAFDYGSILGAVMDARERVGTVKKLVMEMNEENTLACATDADKAAAQPKLDRWKQLRANVFLRKASGVSPELIAIDKSLQVNACGMMLDDVVDLMERCDIAEYRFGEAFDAAVRENNVGTILDWQKPLLVLKRDVTLKRGLDPNGPCVRPVRPVELLEGTGGERGDQPRGGQPKSVFSGFDMQAAVSAALNALANSGSVTPVPASNEAGIEVRGGGTSVKSEAGRRGLVQRVMSSKKAAAIRAARDSQALSADAKPSRAPSKSPSRGGSRRTPDQPDQPDQANQQPVDDPEVPMRRTAPVTPHAVTALAATAPAATAPAVTAPAVTALAATAPVATAPAVTAPLTTAPIVAASVTSPVLVHMSTRSKGGEGPSNRIITSTSDSRPATMVAAGTSTKTAKATPVVKPTGKNAASDKLPIVESFPGIVEVNDKQLISSATWRASRSGCSIS